MLLLQLHWEESLLRQQIKSAYCTILSPHEYFILIHSWYIISEQSAQSEYTTLEIFYTIQLFELIEIDNKKMLSTLCHHEFSTSCKYAEIAEADTKSMYLLTSIIK